MWGCSVSVPQPFLVHRGFVLSVEPDLWLAQLVGRSARELSLSRSKCSCVRVVCASVSDANRVTELSVSERARSSSHSTHASGSTQAQGSRYLQQTVSLTLDFLLEHYPPPSVLKIDVETHEANVLRGATRLLREVHRPSGARCLMRTRTKSPDCCTTQVTNSTGL